MNLNTKKRLAARTLKVGLGRIKFDIERLDEIKEAITKQDIKDLKESGAIKIKEISGRRTNVKRKTIRRAGKYLVSINVTIDNIDTDEFVQTAIYINGAIEKAPFRYSGTASREIDSATIGIFDMAVDDYFEFFVRHFAGQDQTTRDAVHLTPRIEVVEIR